MAIATIRNDDGSVDHLKIACDAPGCSLTPPSDFEVIAAGGLIALGWHCSGGTHLCPDHHPAKENTACSN